MGRVIAWVGAVIALAGLALGVAVTTVSNEMGSARYECGSLIDPAREVFPAARSGCDEKHTIALVVVVVLAGSAVAAGSAGVLLHARRQKLTVQ